MKNNQKNKLKQKIEYLQDIFPCVITEILTLIIIAIGSAAIGIQAMLNGKSIINGTLISATSAIFFKLIHDVGVAWYSKLEKKYEKQVSQKAQKAKKKQNHL